MDYDRGVQAPTAKGASSREVHALTATSIIQQNCRCTQEAHSYRNLQGHLQQHEARLQPKTIYKFTKIVPTRLGVQRACQHGRHKAIGSPHPTSWGHTRRMQRGKHARQTNLWSAFDDGRHSKLAAQVNTTLIGPAA